MSKAFLTGVSLTEYERDLLDRESERRGLYNISATLRMILREWEVLSGERTRLAEVNEANQSIAEG